MQEIQRIMKTYQYYVVNVFSERGLYGGNPLGVVVNTEGMTPQVMQAIARQFNYSESTFIMETTQTGGKVRIFLPTREIPFAGHPTLGTAFVLEREYQTKMNTQREQVVLDLLLGKITVEIQRKPEECLLIMDQFPVKELGEYKNRKKVLSALGIHKNQVYDVPFLFIAPSDLPFLFIPVKSVETLKNMKPQSSALKVALGAEEADAYVFAMEGIDEGNVHARFFAPNSGIVEDPATGSAQAAFMTYLEKTGLMRFPENTVTTVIVEQGYEMKRPSKLYDFIRTDSKGKIQEIRTGGKVELIAKGILHV